MGARQPPHALIDTLPPAGTAFAKGAVAGACYGVSIALYVYAAQRLGAVRTQGVFAMAPFWGVALAAVMYGDRLGAPRSPP